VGYVLAFLYAYEVRPRFHRPHPDGMECHGDELVDIPQVGWERVTVLEEEAQLRDLQWCSATEPPATYDVLLLRAANTSVYRLVGRSVVPDGEGYGRGGGVA
jgi:hypothetical protein